MLVPRHVYQDVVPYLNFKAPFYSVHFPVEIFIHINSSRRLARTLSWSYMKSYSRWNLRGKCRRRSFIIPYRKYPRRKKKIKWQFRINMERIFVHCNTCAEYKIVFQTPKHDNLLIEFSVINFHPLNEISSDVFSSGCIN